MTATADFMPPDPSIADAARIGDGSRLLVRAVQRLAGASLTLAAVGLWLMPSAAGEEGVLLFKLILSVTAVLAGLCLLQASAAPRAPQVEIDTIRREVRLVRDGHEGQRAVLGRCRFGDLSRVEHRGAHLRLWDENDNFLVEVTLTDRSTMNSLVAGLQDAGKLA
tara:strand:- start:86950 stop:87444 length:495 start_codon:yes stop_codon:yes gene_type:complete